jgi:hypothetical protein
MHYKVLLVAFHFLVWAVPTWSQAPRFRDKTDEELKEFMKKQLAAGKPVGRAVIDGFDIEPNIEILRLVRNKDWAVEMILAKIAEVRSRADYKPYDSLFVFSSLIYSERPDRFEIVSTRLKDDPMFDEFVKSLITHSISSPDREATAIWYRALASPNPTVSSIARAELADVFEDPPERHRELWAGAMVDRYGHSPTALEMATDPIFLISKERNPEKAEQTRAVMLSLTEKEYLRRQVPAPVKPQ